MASDFSIDVGLPLVPREHESKDVLAAKAGDHDAYARLVRPYECIAYRVAVAITGRSADAEEAMQNGFVKAYRSLHRFRAGAAFRPWLLRIVVNEAHNVNRSERRHRALGSRAAERHEPAAVAADEAVIAREEVETVLGELARLSDGDRLVLALRYFAELPDAEAARLVGVTTEAYRVRLVRARKRLQTQLGDRDD